MNQLGVYYSWVNITANLSTHFPLRQLPGLAADTEICGGTHFGTPWSSKNLFGPSET
jgi:hypothetical protein